MSLEILMESIPQYAKDVRINLGNVLKQTELTPTQLWGTAVACAVTTRTPAVIRAIEAEALQNVDEQTVSAAKTAAAVMAMNNVWYRFLHLTNNDKYQSTPARLRMQTLRTHGADHTDFELWCTAVSAINNCPACVAAHEKTVREKGLTEEHVAASLRIAAVIEATATAIAEESARL
ncbi:MAG TPA: carboxymuconolactone decarboxylase family protein [Bryobacteraceae bacterium]|nr:carboxymuconolactone decarboxylase family protein [Bryobacteraceae bacterium]